MMGLITLVCLNCGEEFQIRPHRLGIAKYCSRDCQHQANSKATKTLWADSNSGLRNRRKLTLEEKEQKALKVSQNSKAAWADPNSGLRNRRDAWITRRAKGEVPKLRGMTYEEIYGEEKATRVKELHRKGAKRWWASLDEERQEEAREQSRVNGLIVKELMRTSPEYRAECLKRNKRIIREVWRKMSPEDKSERIQKVIIGNRRRPTNPELYLENILDGMFPNEWQYTGDGKLVVGGKCPDFMNINGKKQLIELFGDYWHKDENPQIRINHFKCFGYDTLVVWERELQDIEALTEKLLVFGGENP